MAVVMERGAYVRMLTAVYAALFLIRVAFGVVLVTFPLYVHLPPDQLGLLNSVSPLLELVTIFFAPWVIARYGRKGILLTGLALGAVALYGLALTTEPLLLAAIYMLHGVASGFILVTTLAVIATFAQSEHRGREMGIFNFVNIFGLVAGYIAGSLLVEGFRGQLEYTFVIAGALATIGLLYANRVIKLPEEERVLAPEAPRLGATLSTLRDRAILLLTLPWLIVWMLVGAFVTFVSSVTQGALNISGVYIALVVLALGGLLVFAQLFWGWLADRVGRDVIMLVGAAGLTLMMATVVWGFFSSQSTDSKVVFDAVLSHRLLLALFLFTALAFAPAGLASIADHASGGEQGGAMSAYALTLSLGFILGPPLVGFIAKFDAAYALGGRVIVVFYAAMAGLLFALVLAYYLRTRQQALRPEASPP